jgi:hypothetical protein
MGSGGPTGVVIVRAWIERGAGPGLRIRITAQRDLEAEATETIVKASPEAAAEWLRAWLSDFAEGDGPVTDG